MPVPRDMLGARPSASGLEEACSAGGTQCRPEEGFSLPVQGCAISAFRSPLT